jgi:methyltransferase
MSQLFGIDSRLVFSGLVGIMAVQRVVELSLSRRHVRQARARGGVEAGAKLYPWIVALHSGFLVAAPCEVLWLDRPLIPPLAATMLALLALAQLLRVSAIKALGPRWMTRVVCVPGDPRVTAGPYRWLRHPNYVAVAIEIGALPLVHTAWLTAVVFSLANAGILRQRIAVEERALTEHLRAPGQAV